MKKLFRLDAFRVALVFAGALVATTYVVFLLVDVRFYRSNLALARSVLQNEVAASLNASPDQLRAQLMLRLTQDLRHLDFVGFYDATGRLIFGNVTGLPTVPADGRAHLVDALAPQPDARTLERALIVVRSRPDGGKLLLGRSLVYVDEFERAMLLVFTETIVPVIVVALLIGAMVSYRASRRLVSIKLAIARVMGGDLHVRLPSRRVRSDMDELVEAVNRMLDEIGRLVGQIRSVGDNIAHDLRAPLAAMRARLERGLACADPALLEQVVGQALSELERALATVTALLRISDLESGLRRGQFVEVEIGRVCHDVFELYSPLADAKDLSFRLIRQQPLSLSGDVDLLREAVANLVDNAIKFTPSGGEVILSCGADGSLVRVSDNGPGVAPEDRENILKRFFRAASTSHVGGVGLGLSITATIIDLHGLHLVISSEGEGACFSIVQKPPPGSAKRAAVEPIVKLPAASTEQARQHHARLDV